MLKRSLLLIILLLFSISGYADTEKHSNLNPVKSLLDIWDSEAQKTQEERVADGWWPLVESMQGCGNLQRIRATAQFDSQYECLNKWNNFNNGVSKPLNAGNEFIYQFYYYVGFLLISIVAFTVIRMLSSGHENDSRERKASAITFVMFILILAFVCAPRFENEEGIKTTSMITIGFFAVGSIGAESISIFQKKVSRSAILENPLISIPSPDYRKTNQVYDLVRYFSCISDNVNNSFGVDAGRNGAIKVSYDYGEYSAFAQKGNCVLNMKTSLNLDLVKMGKEAGVDYKAVVDGYLKKALTRAITDAQGVSNKIMSKSATIANPIAFNKDGFNCSNISSYNINSLSNEGLADFAYSSSECISKNLVADLNKYPGIDESFYGSKLKGRLVHLCEQDTFANGGKELDTTKNLIDKGSSYSSLKEKLGQCVTKMCSSDSSPFVCGAAVEYRNKMIGNRHITNPSFLTLPGYFIGTEYQTDDFVNGAKELTNKFNVTFGRASTILDDESDKEIIFTVPYFVAQKGQGAVPNSDSILDNSPVYTASGTEVLTALFRFFDIGDDGMFGAAYTYDCLNYPEQVSPSGRNCSTIFTTIKMQGTRFIIAGTQIRSGARFANVGRRTTTEKTLETASIEATKSSLKSVNVMDTGVVISKIISLGALDYAVDDVYSEYGTKLGPMALYAGALAYSIPSIVGFLDTIGGMLQGIGFFMSYAHQMIIIGLCLGALISLIGMLVYFNYAFMLYFIILMSKNHGVNPTTDWYKTFDTLTKYFYSIVSFPIILTLCFLYAKSIFFVQAFDVEGMLNINSGIATYSDSLASLPSMLGIMAIKMVIPVLVISSILMVAAKTPSIVSSHIFGNLKDDEEEENYELQMKKFNL